MDFYSSEISKTNRGAVTASGNRSQDSAETGISYHKYAKGAGKIAL